MPNNHQQEETTQVDEESEGEYHPGARVEIARFLLSVPWLKEKYQIVSKIGEGTFSSVYKAIDLKNEEYDNQIWQQDATFHPGSGKPFVAIKRLYASSTPQRIANEICLLKQLAQCRGIITLLAAFRDEDQVILILPYFENTDFRKCFRDLNEEQIRGYLLALFTSLKEVHSFGIIHRDIKPANFLYNFTTKKGKLLDFGLAQKQPPHDVDKENITESFEWDDLLQEPTFIENDSRPSIKANRAGTRGFRAPEVLLKVVHQTVAIDIWSVGVILLSILSGRFPFFQSNSDPEAFAEIGCLFGRRAMQKAALRHGRLFKTNLPSIKEKGVSLEKLCENLRGGVTWKNPALFDLLRRCLCLFPEERITASQALEHSFFSRPRS